MEINGRSISFIVHCYLDVEDRLPVAKMEFAQNLRTEAWVKARLEFFRRYTMKSLLNQDFKDFRVFLLCGQTFRHITEKEIGQIPAEIYYDFGIEQYTRKIDTDFVAVTRIDSDDLFHREAMASVADRVFSNPDETEMTFRRWYFWDKTTNTIRKRKVFNSPFVTKVYPSEIYSQFDRPSFYCRLFDNYRTIRTELPAFKVCTILHNRNVTWNRSQKNPKNKNHRRNYFDNPRHEKIQGDENCLNILKDFGMTEKEISH